jgi:hypothetical protein
MESSARKLHELLPSPDCADGRTEWWWGGPVQAGIEQPYGWEQRVVRGGGSRWEVRLARVNTYSRFSHVTI